VLPEADPKEPQVAYTPQESDLPVFTGHPVSMQGTESYNTLWTNYAMFALKNLGSAAKTVFVRHRTSGTSYNSCTFVVNPKMLYSILYTFGLSTPGIGQEENYKLYCPGNEGDVTFTKSWFTVAPYYINRGPMRDLRDVQVISSAKSIFDEDAASVTQLSLKIHDDEVVLIDADNVILPYSRVNSAYRYTLKIPIYSPSGFSSSDLNKVTHKQFRYPTSFIYNMSVR